MNKTEQEKRENTKKMIKEACEKVYNQLLKDGFIIKNNYDNK